MKVSPAAFRRIHAGATLAWAVLALPTVLWWSDSVAWINGMSWYANVASHWAGWQAARSDPDSSKVLLWVHGGGTLVWLALGVPTALWWSNSVPFLAAQSLWANLASHWGAYAGARAEDHHCDN